MSLMQISFKLFNLKYGIEYGARVIQARNAHIVKHYKPQELLRWTPESFYDPHTAHTNSDPRYIYKELLNTDKQKSEPIKVLLLSTVSGLGVRGDIVKILPEKARRLLLLPKLGVYASQENLERYKDLKLQSDEDQASSPHSYQTVNHLGGLILWVSMNVENEWTLQPWHLRVALRKAGVICSEEAIELPSTPITGPNMENQGKSFYFTVTVNNREKVRVRCLLNHVTADLTKKLQYKFYDVTELLDPLLPEQAAYLEALHMQRLPLRSSNNQKQITPEEVEQSAATQ